MHCAPYFCVCSSSLVCKLLFFALFLVSAAHATDKHCLNAIMVIRYWPTTFYCSWNIRRTYSKAKSKMHWHQAKSHWFQGSNVLLWILKPPVPVSVHVPMPVISVDCHPAMVANLASSTWEPCCRELELLATRQMCPAALWTSLGKHLERKATWRQHTSAVIDTLRSRQLPAAGEGAGRPGPPLATRINLPTVKRRFWGLRNYFGTLKILAMTSKARHL